jgi:hypothetical protein
MEELPILNEIPLSKSLVRSLELPAGSFRKADEGLFIPNPPSRFARHPLFQRGIFLVFTSISISILYFYFLFIFAL